VRISQPKKSFDSNKAMTTAGRNAISTGFQKKLVLAPEYGGDGGQEGGCVRDENSTPSQFFPAHWAPNDLLIASNPVLPAVYREGAFVAFHGSWNRAPGAARRIQRGVSQPMKDGKAAGKFIVFADGFAGRIKEPGRAGVSSLRTHPRPRRRHLYLG